MLHGAALGASSEDILPHPRNRRRFAQVQHVVQVGRFLGWVEADAAGKFKAEVFFVQPDVAAVFAGEVLALVEVEGFAAAVADGGGVGFHLFCADDADCG